MNWARSQEVSRSPRGGELRVQVISPRLLTSTMSGRLDIPMAREFLANLDRWVKLGGSQLLAFHDWELVDDYDTDARAILTPWSKLHRPQFERVHMLVRGRTLAWGISIVNSLTNDVIVAHHSRAAFEQARRTSV